ncbi:MAG: hypothetical protein WC563_16105 [Brevundimonas sp.]
MLPNNSDPGSEYGLPKSNFDADGIIDPETDFPASEYEALAVDAAAGTHTTWRAIVLVNWSIVIPSVVIGYRSVWGDEPAVWPVAVSIAAGHCRVDWSAAGYPDLNPTPSRQVTRAPSFIACKVQLGRPGFHRPTVSAASVDLLVFDETYAPDHMPFTLFVR